MRIGILGNGRITNKTMIPALEVSASVELGMIGSRADGFPSYEEVLANKNIDTIYIALPIGLHEEWAIKAAKAGKHIITEKSSTTSYESAKRMVAACEENNVRLMEAFMYRYHPQHERVAQMIEDGDVISFHGLYGSPFSDIKDIRQSKELGGGALNDMGCYPINASRMIFGEEPVRVSCNLVPSEEADIKADVTLFYPNGKSAFCSAAFGAYYQTNYSLWGTKTRIDVPRAYAVSPDITTHILKSIDDDNTESTSFSPVNQTRLMIEDFRRVIRKESNRNYEKDLLSQAKVMEAARISNKEQRIVSLDEIK